MRHIVLATLSLASCAFCGELPERKVIVTTLDDTNQPIQGADAEFIFFGEPDDALRRQHKQTNKQGWCSATGRPFLRMQVNVSKDGYYAAYSPRLSRKRNHDVTYILRKRANPVPLYAKHVKLRIPVVREWVGYDMMVGDLVKPHGLGAVADIKLRSDIEGDGMDSGEGTLEIDFGEGGGLIAVKNDYLPYSDMKMPHHAASGNYMRIYRRKADSYHDRNREPNKGYFFKTSSRSPDGTKKAVNYGKFIEDFHFDPRKSGWHSSHEGMPVTYGVVTFTYYFNPTANDSNLEFDMNNNLLKKLEYTERPQRP